MTHDEPTKIKCGYFDSRASNRFIFASIKPKTITLTRIVNKNLHWSKVRGIRKPCREKGQGILTTHETIPVA